MLIQEKENIWEEKIGVWSMSRLGGLRWEAV